MGSKTGKKANAASKKQTNIPVPKDDGTRWLVMGRDHRPVYPSRGGVTQAEAVRLATGLVTTGYIKQVETSE